jgi:glycine cleavage system regulatory protein
MCAHRARPHRRVNAYNPSAMPASSPASTDVVLTLLGPDRPGLVEAVADAIAAHDGNWLESRMAHLAGRFAGILRVQVPPAGLQAMKEALAALEGRGLRIVVEPGGATAAAGGPAGTRPMRLELVGLDRPGLVREVSRLLAQQGINVEELSTDRSSAPMSGEMMFRAEARLEVPAAVDVAAVRASLERLAGDLMVEIKLAEPRA